MKQLQIPIKAMVKGNPLTVDIGSPITEACELMASTMRDCVLVLDMGRPCGMLTSFSIACRVGEAGTADLAAGDCMVPGPPTIDLGTPVPQALQHMKKRQLHHLAVSSEGKVVGTISARDVAYATDAPTLKGKLK